MQPSCQFNQPYQSGAPSGRQPAKPDNYLVWSILSTICCCVPLGIVSIVYSCRVNTLYSCGRYAEAAAAAANAKKWALIALILGVISGIISFMLGLHDGFNSLSNL